MTLLKEKERLHISIEEQGHEWAKRYFERQGGDLSQTVLVMNSEHLWILDLPSITPEFPISVS